MNSTSFHRKIPLNPGLRSWSKPCGYSRGLISPPTQRAVQSIEGSWFRIAWVTRSEFIKIRETMEVFLRQRQWGEDVGLGDEKQDRCRCYPVAQIMSAPGRTKFCLLRIGASDNSTSGAYPRATNSKLRRIARGSHEVIVYRYENHWWSLSARVNNDKT